MRLVVALITLCISVELFAQPRRIGNSKDPSVEISSAEELSERPGVNPLSSYEEEMTHPEPAVAEDVLRLERELAAVMDAAAKRAEIEQDYQKLKKEVDWLTHRLNKMQARETDRWFDDVKLAAYKRSSEAPPNAGEAITLFGKERTITAVPLADNPLFPNAKRYTVTMPLQDDKCCGRFEPMIHFGLSSYPRAFVPFSTVYGPPEHRVEFTQFNLGDYAGDYALGAMSDYSANFASAVINIQLEAGMFLVVRLGYEVDPRSPKSISDINNTVHTLLDSISIAKN